LVDKKAVGEFLQNAENILAVASRAADRDGQALPVAILIGWAGDVRVVAGSDWPLESLQAEHGARMAYHVSETKGQIRVEGRSGSCRCVLESPAHGTAPNLLRAWNSNQPSFIR